MGANQSMPPGYRGGPVKLRRRSATTGVTGDELDSAGVDIAKAVAQNTALEQRRALQQASGAPASPAPAIGTPAAAAIAAAAAPAAPAAPGAAAPVAPGAGEKPLNAAAAALQPRRKAAPTIELPPWEVVMNLSDTDWYALRGWLDNGWRCRKCGNCRDDHNEHPKAIRLLGACGVVPPQLRKSGAASPSASSVRGPSGVEYGSASPDNQVGYLSDSSPSSSLQSSPLHPRSSSRLPPGAPGGIPAGEGSPRFREGSPFDSQGGIRPLANAHGGSGVLGVEACPHLSSLQGGGSTSMRSEPGMPPRQNSGASDMAASANAAMMLAAGSPSVAPGSGKWDALRLKVLQAITRAQQVYFIDKEPNGSLVFDFLLSALLDCTQSGFGFISSALLKADGTPYLKTHAMSNVAWTKELRAWYGANAHKGLVFTNMNTLHGSIVLSGQPVITNDPQSDPRSRGVPPGHPELTSFMGIPLYTGTELIGIYGLANRGGDGYSEQLMKELEPLTFTVAQMIYAVNERKRRKEAELHLASVVQVAKEGICSLSHSGHVTSMNLAARVMFGFAKDGEKRGEEVPPPASLQFQDIVLEIDGRTDFLQNGLEHHSGHVHTGRGLRADGTHFPLEVSLSRGTYDTVFFVAVIRDMSEILDTQHKLEESEERWQYSVSGIEDGVWDWNMEQNTFFFSAKWFQNLGYEPTDMSASIESWDNLVHPDDKEGAYAALKDHLDGVTEAYSHEHRMRCKDGSYRWFLHRGRVVHRTDAGEPVHFVGTHSDMTDKKKFQDASSVVKEASHHLMRLEAEYLARAGMDVHEPAAAILERTEELGKTELSEAQKECVERIEECGQRLVAVVQDQLEVRDIESGKVALEFHIFAVAEVIETAVLVMADRATAKGLETVIEMAPDTPLFIVSDANHCMEVMINLLSAAIMETSKGYVRVRLAAEMVFPHHDDEDAPDIGDGSESRSVSISEDGSEDVLYGDGHHLHGPQLHLVITVDGTGTSQAALSAENTIAIQTPRKLLPLLGGTLGTMIDPKRGAIYTARIPVNSHHPEYKGAMAMRAAKPLQIRDPLLHTRVLVVGSTQVTMAAIGKQLNAWHIPHSIASTSPENAFLKSFPEGKLPKVVVPPGDEVATVWADGTPKTGLALVYDIVIVDCSSRTNMKDDENLKKMAAVMGRDRVGVIVLTKTQWRETRSGADSPDDDALAMFAAAEGGYWNSRKPVVLHKPMVRPLCLLAALETAFASIPGKEGVLSQSKSSDDLLLLHGFLKKAATKRHRRRHAKATGPKYKGRVLIICHNKINIHAVELLLSARGGVHMDSSTTLEGGMKLMEKQPYDIIFLDCHLKDMEDVHATLRKIRELEGQSAEIIATKSQLQKAEEESMIAAGATGCIARPLTTAKLELFFKEHLIEVKE